MTTRRALPRIFIRRTFLLGLLGLCLSAVAPQSEASQWLKLTAPVKDSSTAPLASTVKFEYVIDIPGFRHHTNWNGVLGTWITVCTGGCSTSADIIDGHELTPAEQSSYTLPIAKIKQHLTQYNLPIGTKIKWNLEFHLPGTFYVQSERQTDSHFYLGHVEAAVPIHVEAKPTATATPKPIH